MIVTVIIIALYALCLFAAYKMVRAAAIRDDQAAGAELTKWLVALLSLGALAFVLQQVT